MHRAVLLSAVALFACALAGCSSSPPAPAPDGAAFTPEVWFLGEMHSSGRLKLMGGAPKALHVDSSGRALADGSVRLDQAIHWDAGRTDNRFWLLRREPGGGYAVTLSDARGPVAFDVAGSRAHLKYRMKGRWPLTMEQWMDLQADGRTLQNHGVVRLLGVPIGALDEPIVHEPF